ncbi:MAG: hypothetical protein U1D55_02795 [Phycisphaerae bacterium]
MRSNLRLGLPGLTVALLNGCYAPDPPVTNESVAETWQRADQTVARADEADRHLWHVQRLREIDRLHSSRNWASCAAWRWRGAVCFCRCRF